MSFEIRWCPPRARSGACASVAEASLLFARSVLPVHSCALHPNQVHRPPSGRWTSDFAGIRRGGAGLLPIRDARGPGAATVAAEIAVVLHSVCRPMGDKQEFPLRSNGRRGGTSSLLSFLVSRVSFRGEKGTTDGCDGRRSSHSCSVALSDPRGDTSPWFHPAWTLGRVRVQFRCKVRGARAAAAPRSSVGAMHGGWVGASSPMTSPQSVPGLAATGRAGACVCTPQAGPTPAWAGPGLVLGALGQLACAPLRARTSGVAC